MISSKNPVKPLPNQKKQIIYMYKVDNKLYVDFNILLYLYGDESNPEFHRSNLYRYMRTKAKEKKIRSISIGNKKVFLWDDVLSDTLLLGNMSNINALTSLANALTEE